MISAAYGRPRFFSPRHYDCPFPDEAFRPDLKGRKLHPSAPLSISLSLLGSDHMALPIFTGCVSLVDYHISLFTDPTQIYSSIRRCFFCASHTHLCHHYETRHSDPGSSIARSCCLGFGCHDDDKWRAYAIILCGRHERAPVPLSSSPFPFRSRQ